MWPTLLFILHLGLMPQVSAQSDANAGETDSYNQVIAVEDHFIAVGTSGRIDLISKSGEVTRLISHTVQNLNAALYAGGRLLVAGDHGTLLISGADHAFIPVDIPGMYRINSIALFQNHLIAAGDHGTLLIQNPLGQWEEIQSPVTGNIVSISANTTICTAVTGSGEILSSPDGTNWDVFDYNAHYTGYAKPCIFTKVFLAESRTAIVGRHEDNTPAVLFSSGGNVWQERSLNYRDGNGIPQVFTSLPNAITYDPVGDQFFIVCNEGDVAVLSSCTKCNKMYTLTDKNLRSIACVENILMIVGDELYIQPVSIR